MKTHSDYKRWGDDGCYKSGNWPRAKVAQEFYGHLSGQAIYDEEANPLNFERAWLRKPEVLPVPFKNLPQYLAWRSIMIAGLEAFSGQTSLDSQQKAVRNEARKDDWLRLREAFKERGASQSQQRNLLSLRLIMLKVGKSPAGVSRNWAEDFQTGLEKKERALFRTGLAAMDVARSHTGIQREFGLDDTPLGPLTKKLSPNERRPLPQSLSEPFETWIKEQQSGEIVGFRGRRRTPILENTIRKYRFAIAWYWRAFSGAFPDEQSPCLEDVASTDAVTDALAFSKTHPDLKLSAAQMGQYLGCIVPFLQQTNPKLSVSEVTE